MTNDIIDVEAKEVVDPEQIKQELNHPNFKKWFAGLLHETEVHLDFIKANGETRKMRCTLHEDNIPEDKRPKNTGRKQAEDTIAVFDLDKQEWRSFRYDSIQEFTWDLPEDSEYPTAPVPVFFDENGNEIVETEEGDEVGQS